MLLEYYIYFLVVVYIMSLIYTIDHDIHTLKMVNAKLNSSLNVAFDHIHML